MATDEADVAGAPQRAPRQVHSDRPDDACYVLFGSSTAAFALFEELKRRSLRARISPTPRLARACCGTSLLVGCDDCERIEDVAVELGISIESIARLPCQIDPARDRFC